MINGLANVLASKWIDFNYLLGGAKLKKNTSNVHLCNAKQKLCVYLQSHFKGNITSYSCILEREMMKNTKRNTLRRCNASSLGVYNVQQPRAQPPKQLWRRWASPSGLAEEPSTGKGWPCWGELSSSLAAEGPSV